MLEELRIRDVGVIEDVTLTLAPGLNVLTGETGAGKTMVVSALELLLGARADADQVRTGAAVALVEGRLRPIPADSAEWVDDADDELVVSREVAAAGRSRARIGGRLAPASALADALGAAIEIHGQHDSARLAAPAVQRALLDRFGGPPLEAALAAYQEAYRSWTAAADEAGALQADERERARQCALLEYELAEIDGVGPVAGESAAITTELARLEHAEALVDAATAAASAVAADGGARDALGSAVARLRATAGHDPALDTLLGRAEGLAAEAQDLGMELGGYADGLALDPARLESLRARRAAVAGLTRKYGPDEAAVLAYADDARARLAGLRGGDERARLLAEQAAALRSAVAVAAEALSTQRRSSAATLVGAVEGHLAELALAAARMTVTLEPVPPGAHGADRVTYLLAANAGEVALPLGKAASGGERSRVALALRLALADADDTPVLVFDEVDAGIGGATALAVGRKLARLARGRQVLCVTHLAQLAAFSDAHFVVVKAQAGERTVAAVERVDDAARVRELSRMLSGTPGSAAAATHAAELRALAVAAAAAP